MPAREENSRYYLRVGDFARGSEVIIECVLEFRIEAADTFIQRSAPERGWLGNHEICVQADIELNEIFGLGTSRPSGYERM